MSTSSESLEPAVAAQPVHFVSMYQKRTKIYARSVRGLYARLRWAIVALTQSVLLRPALAGLERPSGGAVRPRRAALLHLRPGAAARRT